jgi:hypothetical protein
VASRGREFLTIESGSPNVVGGVGIDDFRSAPVNADRCFAINAAHVATHPLKVHGGVVSLDLGAEQMNPSAHHSFGLQVVLNAEELALEPDWAVAHPPSPN